MPTIGKSSRDPDFALEEADFALDAGRPARGRPLGLRGARGALALARRSEALSRLRPVFPLTTPPSRQER